jgi:hypothetical protein
MLEKTISNSIIKYLNKHYTNALVVKRWSTGSSGNTGYPDITGSINGIRVEIEVKTPGNKPTKLQYSRIKKLQGLNIIAFWTDSLESCVERLDRELATWQQNNQNNQAA